jgi:hypothetical protein
MELNDKPANDNFVKWASADVVQRERLADPG